jgi:energy-coupling factor transporter ATP-binding protein EcfA2
VNFLADLTLLAVILAAAGLIGTRALPAPAFVAVCLVAIVVFEPIIGLPGAVAAMARARAACARLTELFPSSATPVPASATPLARTFPYPTQIKLEDHDIEFALTAGDTVLLTGASGTGKSTILRAISGQPEHVTLVAQDAHVFDGSIRENLKLADPLPVSQRSGQPLPPPRSTTRSRPSQRGSTPLSGQLDRRSLAASAAASASRRACSATPTSYSSTSPPKPSTRPRQRAYSPASGSSIHRPRSSSPYTTVNPWLSPGHRPPASSSRALTAGVEATGRLVLESPPGESTRVCEQLPVSGLG